MAASTPTAAGWRTAEYLTEAIKEDTPELFLIALRNVLLDLSTEPTKTTPRLTL